MTKTTLAALMITLGAMSTSLAHDPKPQNGGSIVVAGTYHVELVANDTQVDVYLLDHSDKTLSAKGHKGVAILMIDGKSVRIPLQPVEDKRLSGSAPVTLPRTPKGVVQISEPTGGTVQARFN